MCLNHTQVEQTAVDLVLERTPAAVQSQTPTVTSIADAWLTAQHGYKLEN